MNLSIIDEDANNPGFLKYSKQIYHSYMLEPYIAIVVHVICQI